MRYDIPVHVKREVEFALQVMTPTGMTRFKLDSVLFKAIGYINCAHEMGAITDQQCINLSDALYKKWEWCNLNMRT